MSLVSRSLAQHVQTALMDTFTRSLHPDAPEHCAQSYMSCILIVQSWDTLPKLRLTRPDFFAAALRFLVHPRTEEDLERLDSRMSQCSCSRTGQVSRLLHRIVLPSGPPNINLKALLDSMGSLLVRCVGEMAGKSRELIIPLDAGKRSKRAQKPGRRLPWPEQPADLSVFSPEQIIYTLWKIFHKYESDSVLLFLQTVMTISGTTFTSLLYSTIPSFPQEYMFHFKRAISSTQVNVFTVGGLSSFLSLVLIRSGYNDDHAPQFMIWLPYVHEMLMLLTKAISSLWNVPDFTKVIASLPFIGADLICKYRLFVPLNPPQYAPEILRVVAQGESVDLMPTVWWSVHRIAQSDRCYAPGCGETFSKQNRRFAVCTGCGIMAYCSKPCQTADWKHARVPHKPLCKSLQAYCGKFSLDWKKTTAWEAQTIRERSREEGVTEEEAGSLIMLLNQRY